MKQSRSLKFLLILPKCIYRSTQCEIILPFNEQLHCHTRTIYKMWCKKNEEKNHTPLQKHGESPHLYANQRFLNYTSSFKQKNFYILIFIFPHNHNHIHACACH